MAQEEVENNPHTRPSSEPFTRRAMLKSRLRSFAIWLFDRTKEDAEVSVLKAQEAYAEIQSVKVELLRTRDQMVEVLEGMEKAEDEVAKLRAAAPKKRAPSRKKT